MKVGIAGFSLLCILELTLAHSNTTGDDLIHKEDHEHFVTVPDTLRRVYQADFDQRAEEWVRELQNDTGQEIEWYDMYLKKDHLRDTPEYSKYHIDVYSDNFEWKEELTNSWHANFVYTKWYYNGGSQPITSSFSKTIENEDQYTWTVKYGIDIQVSASVTVGIPIILQADADASAKFDISSTESQSQTVKNTFHVDNSFTVPAKTKMKVDFIIFERELRMAYTTDIIIEGYIAVWFKEKWRDHWLWFFPISRLKNDEFTWSPCRGLRYGYKGVFTGIHGQQHELHVSEYPYQPQVERTNSTMSVEEPVKVYQIKPSILMLKKYTPKSG